MKNLINKLKYKVLKPILKDTYIANLIWLFRENYHLLVMDKIGKGIVYDRQTLHIINNFPADANCVDVGCNKGKILHWIVNACPNGEHYAFEPFERLYLYLKTDFPNVNVFNVAVGKKTGVSQFYEVVSQEAYSGLKNRINKDSGHNVVQKQVQEDTLDNILPITTKIDFIKIDVEGGEFDVILGAKNLIKTSKPIIIFEFEKDACDFYNVNPKQVFLFFKDELNYGITSLKSWINLDGREYKIEEFIDNYNSESEFYHIAFPK